jgi:hypothetical protein
MARGIWENIGPAARRSCLLMAVLTAPGCSFVFMRPVTTASVDKPQECSTTRAPPIIDTVLAVNDGLGALMMAGIVSSRNDLSKDDETATKSFFWGGLAGTILFGASAIYGYQTASACNDALPQLQRLETLRRVEKKSGNAQCDACDAACRSDKEACSAGNDKACTRARGCLCNCQLESGGCGEPKEKLEKCVAVFSPTTPAESDAADPAAEQEK